MEVCERKKKLIGDLCTPDASRTLHDVLYGPLQISHFASEIINSAQFQRLQQMKQLGLSSCIFPNADHTRYAHSIGTYHQSKKLTERLAVVTPSQEMNEYLKNIVELNEYFEKNYKSKDREFDEYVRELINIAALCHDLGHGPFSHIYDDIFIKKSYLSTHENAKHEKRSQLLIEIIILNSEFLRQRIHKDHIKLIQNIIDPGPQHAGFIYQIVSNNANSLDVDKFDYITRDMATLGIRSSFDYRVLTSQAVIINNMIAYPTAVALDIQQLFQMRHFMHRTVYSNKIVMGAHLLITDMMNKLNELIGLANSIMNMDDFCEYTDSYVMQYPKFLKAELKKNTENKKTPEELVIINKIIELSNRYSRNDFYVPVFGFIMSENIKFDKTSIFKDIFANYIDDIIIHTVTVGFVSGDKSNPLDNTCLYDDIKYVNEKITYIGSTIKKNKFGITNIIPNSYQEYVTVLFFKKTDQHSKDTIIPKIEKHFKDYIAEYLKESIINYIKI